MTQQVSAALAIGDFVGAVLPHFADHYRIALFFHGGIAQCLDKCVRQFVGHVQPPAGGSGTQPAAHDGVCALDDEIHIRGGALPHLGQRVDAPPGGILIRPMGEIVPFIPGGILALGCAQGVIPAAGVKIAAPISRVVKHAVQNYPYAPLGRFAAQQAEVLFRAQHRVDFAIITGVVTVVGGGFKNGVEIHCGYRKTFQIVQPGQDAL